MKALADIKRRQISMTVAQLPDQDFDYQLPASGKPRHRLHAVAPLEKAILSDSLEVDEEEFAMAARDSQTMVSKGANLVIRQSFMGLARMTNPKLTTEEFIEVRLATVRESTRHCYWPSDVVARFAAADVIR